MTKEQLTQAADIDSELTELKNHLKDLDKAVDIIEKNTVGRAEEKPYDHTFTPENSVILVSFEAYHSDVKKFQFWTRNELALPAQFLTYYRERLKERIKQLETQFFNL